MNITGGHNRLIQLVRQIDNLPVDILQLFVARYLSRIDEKTVIGKGLYFQIIIWIRYPKELLFFLSLENCTVNLTGFTSASQDKTLSVFCQNGFWYSRPFIEIFQMTFLKLTYTDFSGRHRFLQAEWHDRFHCF